MIRRIALPLLVALLATPPTLGGVSAVLGLVSEWRFPPVGRFVDIAGGRLHLVDTGVPHGVEHTLPLVLIHGASSSLLDLRHALAPPLAEARRVVLVDRPGHGYSDRATAGPSPVTQARAIREALAELGIERSIWIGHSWGGAVVMAGLVEFPDALAGAVSIAGVSHPWEGGSASHVEFSARPLLGPLFAWQFIQPGGRLTLDRVLAYIFAPEAVPDDYVTDTGTTLSLRPWVFRHNAVDLNRLPAFLTDLVAGYGDLTAPLLSITGTGDEVVPAWNHAERLDGLLARHTWIELDGAGHGLHHTRAGRIAELTLDFAACIERAPGEACPLTATKADSKIRRPVRE